MGEIPKTRWVDGHSIALSRRRVRHGWPGRRRVTMWKSEDCDSYLLKFASGKHETFVRLSPEAVEAVGRLYQCLGGPKTTDILMRFTVGAAGEPGKWESVT